MKQVKTKAKDPATIDAYIAGFSVDVQARLQKIRAAIRKAAPTAQESISYRIAAFKLDGKPLLYFAAFKAHIGVYPMTGGIGDHFGQEIAPYLKSKGTAQFPHDKPVRAALIGRIAKFRAKEMTERAAAKPGKRQGKSADQ